MGFYEKRILPKLTHCMCGLKTQMRQRAKIVPEATGTVLELGVGSGLNIPFYDDSRVEHLHALDPSPEAWAIAASEVERARFSVDYLEAPAEEIPLADDAVDTILVTYTLCTLPDPERSFGEMRRVLRPNGRILFCEHGEAPDAGVRVWQDRLNPVWKRFSGGCNLNRNIPAMLRTNGFVVDRMETMYLPGWRPVSYNFWGSATVS